VTHSPEARHSEGVDLGSTNGTRVNGKRVDSAYLVDGSTITIGNTTMTVVTGWR
jgi:pSer/pThr/pTyr-binding forkhead associated (FHA) protein